MSIHNAVIQKIKAEQFVAGPVTEQTNLYTDLGFDSLTFVTLLVQIEEHFSITINIDEMQSCVQVGQLIKLVEMKMNGGEYID